MFTATVRATESTDVNAAIADLRANCERAGLAPNLTNMAVGQAHELLEQFVQRGRELVSIGSQTHITREVRGEGYSIKLVFQTGGSRRSFFARILDAVWSR